MISLTKRITSTLFKQGLVSQPKYVIISWFRILEEIKMDWKNHQKTKVRKQKLKNLLKIREEKLILAQIRKNDLNKHWILFLITIKYIIILIIRYTALIINYFYLEYLKAF